MNAVIITLAHRAAINAVKRDILSRRGKLSLVRRADVVAAARDYLRDHPELLDEAAETVRKVPQLRTLAEREVRRRRRNQR
jgi:Copper resistance protein ScsC N-terminal domain